MSKNTRNSRPYGSLTSFERVLMRALEKTGAQEQYSEIREGFRRGNLDQILMERTDPEKVQEYLTAAETIGGPLTPRGALAQATLGSALIREFGRLRARRGQANRALRADAALQGVEALEEAEIGRIIGTALQSSAAIMADTEQKARIYEARQRALREQTNSLAQQRGVEVNAQTRQQQQERDQQLTEAKIAAAQQNALAQEENIRQEQQGQAQAQARAQQQQGDGYKLSFGQVAKEVVSSGVGVPGSDFGILGSAGKRNSQGWLLGGASAGLIGSVGYTILLT